MRIFTLIITTFLTLTGFLALSQSAGFVFEKNDVKPGFIAATRQYNDSSLWGYIDGGADIYLEYGFKKLTHQEIVFRGLLFKSDIYEMTDSAAAFGIYSVSVLKCQNRGVLTTFDCFNPYQVQFTLGHYYVSISNIRGDSTAISGGRDLANRLLKKANFRPFTPPTIFQSGLLSEFQPNLKVIYGYLGLQNGFPDWTDRFEGMKNYYITLLSNTDSTGTILLARISFDKKGDMSQFREFSGLKEKVNSAYWKLSEKDKVKALILLDDTNCLYLETTRKHRIFEELIQGFEKVGTKAGDNTININPK